jgi:thiamine-phosphate pyrophosphorylase
MSSRSLPRLYSILDPEQTRGRDPRQILEALLRGGVSMVQLRAKTFSARQIYELARAIHEPLRQSGCRLIINDRVDVALACEAAGVHLGQDDLPLAAARQQARAMLIGVSTHTEEQAREAEASGADYVGFGPIFGTRTKDTGYAPRGIEMLRRVRQALRIPIVAIGGINEANIAQTWAAGADSAAIISDILAADDISGKVARLVCLGAQAGRLRSKSPP